MAQEMAGVAGGEVGLMAMGEAALTVAPVVVVAVLQAEQQVVVEEAAWEVSTVEKTAVASVEVVVMAGEITGAAGGKAGLMAMREAALTVASKAAVRVVVQVGR